MRTLRITRVASREGGMGVAFGMGKYAFCAGGLGFAVVELFDVALAEAVAVPEAKGSSAKES